MEKKITVTPGDGIGQDVTKEGIKILKAVASRFDMPLKIEEFPVGGAAYDHTGSPLPDETLQACKNADAVLFGAVGGPKWDLLDHSVRPEKALLGVRSQLGLYASLRPVQNYSDLTHISNLKPEVIAGVDIMVVREFSGGIYFGTPRGIEVREDQRVGWNTLIYSESEIERVARKGFEIARKRNKKLTSIDKANILEATALWRNVVSEVGRSYPDVSLNHMYVDNAAMQLMSKPRQFDTILTSNLFGDILSDIAGIIVGSIGMIPSGSMGDSIGLYEPSHGTAPKMVGLDSANPIGAILAVGMMFRYSLGLDQADELIRTAVKQTIVTYRTRDIMAPGKQQVGCTEMGDHILEQVSIGARK